MPSARARPAPRPSLKAAHVPAPALDLQASFPHRLLWSWPLGMQTHPQPRHPNFKSSLPPEGTGAPFSPMTAPKIQRWGCFEWATHTRGHTHPNVLVHGYVHSTTHPCTHDSNHHVLWSRDDSSRSCLFILFQVSFPYRIGKSPTVCNTLCWRLHRKENTTYGAELPGEPTGAPPAEGSVPAPSEWPVLLPHDPAIPLLDFTRPAYLPTHTASSEPGTHTALL